MAEKNDSGRNYNATAQILHWGSVLLVAVAWLLGSFSDDLPKGSFRELGAFVHVSAGQLIVVLLLTRLIWRAVSPPPPMETTPLGKWADRSGGVMHFALYALLAAVPIAGVVTLFAGGDALLLFGLGEIPSPWSKDKAFEHDVKEVHETLANILVVLAFVHASAALAHHFYFRDRTLRRMLPNAFGSRLQ